MPHATAATPAALPAPAATTNCRPESRRFPVIRFGHAARTSLPFVIAGTLAVSASGLSATPAHAVPVERPAMPQRFLKPTAQRTVQSVVVTSQVVASKAAKKAAPKEYTVVAGDTVSEIADRFGLKTQAVLAANGLDSTSIIFPGQHLKLAGGSAPAAKASTAKKYTVKSGDTMSGIAERTGSGLAALLAANGLVASSLIFPGQAIVVPGSQSSPAPAPAPKAAVARTHTVVAGDTMSGIAETAGTSLGDLLAANSLVPTSIIYPGQSIVVPGADFTVASTGKAEAATETTTDELPEITMTDERRANAETVIRVGRNAGVNDYGIVIALAAAMQESGLKNFNHGDRDSLGIFQQRPSTGWGTAAQTRDPERAARAFFGGEGNPNPGRTRGLLDIPGWEKMTVSQAAQAVQISGWPNHYAKWEAAARDWLEQLG
ncbi:LysM peptidoglycan-binding domain-containing protein [Homoserinimonas sp. OAct 916]|uniref:muramidase family protein n=1 Tax=Homoserinimonas sp. OAct 916 TaxID=2211450 RepID=UPI000DBE5CE4|nr:LysM peptidoglycan-binding domain-containing protein [Homoserinimonas sp. OAct 916]